MPMRSWAMDVSLARPPRLARPRRLAVLLLVRFDGLLQVAILLAGEEAERVETAQVLPGLRQVTQHQIGLADVLVRTAVLRVEGERLLIDRDRGGGIAVL